MSSKIPQHIAIIMDGNGRWAMKRGLSRSYGHRAGARTIKRILDIALAEGIKYLTFFAFSTENWKRPQEEIDTLMTLFSEYIDKKAAELKTNQDIRIKAIGRWHELPGELPKKINNIIELTKKNDKLTVILAMNYGSRREILDAIDKILEEKDSRIFKKGIDEDTFRKYLYAPDVPDPDLLIRTSGEYRLSNFLLWQISYTEVYITKKLWPNFSKSDFRKAIKSYQKRKRKYGSL